MSNYTKSTDFTSKDSLPSGDSQKVIRGSEFDTEFSAIATAVNSKADKSGDTVVLTAGTVSAPSLTTVGDTNTGIYFPAADKVAIATGGTQRVIVDDLGNVGVGITSPLLRLDASSDNPTRGIVQRIRNGASSSQTGSQTLFTQNGIADWVIGQPAGENAFVFWSARNTANDGAERMRLDSSGNLGIGTSSPSGKLEVRDTNATGVFSNSSTRYGFVQWENTGGEFRIGTDGAFGLRFDTNTQRRMTIDSSGNLGLGVTPSAWNTSQRAIQVGAYASFRGDTATTGVNNNAYYNSSGQWVYQNTNSATRYEQNSGNHFWFTAPSGTAGNTITFTQAMTLDASGNLLVGTAATASGFKSRIVSAGENILLAESTGTAAYINVSDSTSTNSPQIGSSGNNLVFRTGATGSVERMRLDSAGKLRIGTTSGTGPVLTGGLTTSSTETELFIGRSGAVESSSVGDGASIQLQNATNTTACIIQQYSNNLQFFNHTGTVWTERARIDAGGNFLIARTSSLSGYSSRIGLTHNGNTEYGIMLQNSSTTNSNALSFINSSNSLVGSITVSTSATAYNTSSDYRLKDNPQPLTGSGAFIDSLQPKTWTWKADGTRGVGFIAHEVKAVSPNTVVGEKDAVDEEGNAIMQGMEYGSAEFIANIIAELQSLRSRVATLENN